MRLIGRLLDQCTQGKKIEQEHHSLSHMINSTIANQVGMAYSFAGLKLWVQIVVTHSDHRSANKANT